MAVGFGDSDLSSPNSNLSLDLLARARFVSDNDNSLAGFGADLSSLGPNTKSLLSVLSSLDSDATELDFVRSDLGSPSFQVGFGARTWLISDDDHLAGLFTSCNPASKNIFVSNELLSFDLHSKGSDLSLLNSFRKSRVSHSVKSNLISVNLRTTSFDTDIELSSDLEPVNDSWSDKMSVFERASFSFANISKSVGTNNSGISDSSSAGSSASDSGASDSGASDSGASDSSSAGSSASDSVASDSGASDSSSAGSSASDSVASDFSSAGSSSRNSLSSRAIDSSDRCRGV